jgi:hypothetical protein
MGTSTIWLFDSARAAALRTASGLMQARWFKSGGHRGSLIGALAIIVRFGLCGRDIAHGLHRAVWSLNPDTQSGVASSMASRGFQLWR